MEEQTAFFDVYQDQQDCHGASVARLERARERLEALDLKKSHSRKERFSAAKQLQNDMRLLKRGEADALKELEGMQRKEEEWEKVEGRMRKKLQEICETIDAQVVQVAPGAVREAARLRRLEVQVEALDDLLSASQLPSDSNCLTGGLWEDSELEPLRVTIAEARATGAQREAECVEAGAEAVQLKEKLAKLLLPQVQAELAQLDTTVPSSATAALDDQASAGGGAIVIGDEPDGLRHWQRLHQDVSLQLSLSKLEARAAAVPAAPAATVSPTSRSTPAVALAPAELAVAATPSSASAGEVPVLSGTCVAATAPAAATEPTAATPKASSAPEVAEGASADSAAPVTTAPPAKGKGKGKGKGSMPKAPPPPSKAGLPRGPPRSEPSGKKSNLLNLNWKVLKDEPPIVDVALSKDSGFLAKTSQLAAAFAAPVGGAGDEASQLRVHAMEKSRRDQRRQELRLPLEASDNSSASAPAPAQRDTVFSNQVTVKEMSAPLLEAYFKAQVTKVKLADTGGADGWERLPLLDKKFLQMLGIVLTKHKMAYKGETEATAVLSIKRAVLRCDYDMVPQEILALIMMVVKGHREDGSEVTKLVQKEGEAALLKVQQSLLHQMVHELLKVPQIDERLECMLFQSDWERNWRQCTKHLEILKQALEALDRKREVFGKFFSTALLLGQGLNRDSKAVQAPRGFQLGSLEKLVLTKSTRSPKHDLMHFVLALMQPEDVEALFNSEDIAKLARAKALKSGIVYQDCIELVQGFFALRDICETGNYKSQGKKGNAVKMERRRKTMVPGMRPKAGSDSPDEEERGKENEAPIDSDDGFHDVMKAFVDTNLAEARNIAKGCFSVFKVFKELALFFDDVSSLWPPPVDEKGPKIDLIAVSIACPSRCGCTARRSSRMVSEPSSNHQSQTRRRQMSSMASRKPFQVAAELWLPRLHSQTYPMSPHVDIVSGVAWSGRFQIQKMAVARNAGSLWQADAWISLAVLGQLWCLDIACRRAYP